jgi:hypothetical protein
MLGASPACLSAQLACPCRSTCKLGKLSLWMWLTGIGCAVGDILSWQFEDVQDQCNVEALKCDRQNKVV